MNPFHFFMDEESFMQQVMVMSLYNQMGHSDKLNARQCHFDEIHEGWMFAGGASCAPRASQRFELSVPGQPSLSINTTTAGSSTRFSDLLQATTDGKIFHSNSSCTHTSDQLGTIPDNAIVDCNPSLYFPLLKVIQKLKARWKQTCWWHSKGHY